ncbi:hypothetical protein CPB85DRAFT_1259665 [Mucidula mucida]|nr:hypothetical protein CPB85DRAFT_1259665 [Mucidula mucida]
MPRMSTAPSQLPPSPVNACADPSTFISRARALHSSRRTRAIVAVVDGVPVTAITSKRACWSVDLHLPAPIAVDWRADLEPTSRNGDWLNCELDRTNSAFDSCSTLILRLSALTIMGIPSLYQHVKSTAQVVSLHEMSAIKGFVAQRREKGYIVVGIDAWWRGKKVIHSPGWLVRIFKELINAFRFYHHNAHGKAEAELAAFNYRKFINVVITNDSDALIFGTCILGCGLDFKEPFPSLTIYSRNHITEDLGMSPGGLLLFALLVGGDYNKTGLKGGGGATAAGLAKTRLGDDLRNAFHNMTPADFVIFCIARLSAHESSQHHSKSFVGVAKRLHDPNAQNSFVLAQINLRKSQVVQMDAFLCLAMATYRQYSVKMTVTVRKSIIAFFLFCAPLTNHSIISGEGGPGSSAVPTFLGYNWDDGGSDAGNCNSDGKAENSDINDSLVIDMEDVEVEIVCVEHVQRPAEVIVILDNEDGGTGGTVEVIDILDDEQDGALAMSGIVEVIDISDDEE